MQIVYNPNEREVQNEISFLFLYFIKYNIFINIYDYFTDINCNHSLKNKRENSNSFSLSVPIKEIIF